MSAKEIYLGMKLLLITVIRAVIVVVCFIAGVTAFWVGLKIGLVALAYQVLILFGDL